MQTKYFKRYELECPCCGAMPVENGVVTEDDYQSFLSKIDELREVIDFPFKPNSAYRCTRHNQDVGGSLNSAHLKGLAIDIPCSNERAGRVLKAALDLGFTGIGVYQDGGYGSRFIHVDMTHKQLTIWSK